jgi:hypothetical protein
VSRHAILIGSVHVPGQTPLLGAEVDVKRLYQFLRSKVGGAWSIHEITPLIDPTCAEVQAAVLLRHKFDYCFVAFSGHGKHPKSGLPLKTHVVMVDGWLRVEDLHPGSEKCSIVVDACRKQVAIETEVEKFIVEHAKVASKAPDRLDYERAFFSALERCPASTTYIFSCGIGETAAEDPELGGVFTRSLVSQAIDWEERCDGWHRTQSLMGALLRAIPHVRSAKQLPVLERDVAGGRHFPFAVYLG